MPVWRNTAKVCHIPPQVEMNVCSQFLMPRHHHCLFLNFHGLRNKEPPLYGTMSASYKLEGWRVKLCEDRLEEQVSQTIPEFP